MKNLIKLSTSTDLYLFNRQKKTWTLKKPEKIIQECEKNKQKEIKTITAELSNLAKLNNLTNITVKKINNKLENKIEKLDEIIKCAKNLNKNNNQNISNKFTSNQENIKDNIEDKYLAFYSN